MATLRRGTQTITVPDEAAASYVSQGWREAGATIAPAETQTPAVRRSSPRPRAQRGSTTAAVTAKKEATDGVPSGTDGAAGPSSADPGSV